MSTILRAFAREHSALSPSSFERIAACTMSYRLAERRGPTVSSGAALVGTAAHAVLEWCLRHEGGPEQIESVFVEGKRIGVDARMRAAVQVALDWIRAELAGRALLIEHKVALPWGRITGWLDAATTDEPFVVVDFKYGYEVVGADASQLGTYLLALLLECRGSIRGAGAATAVVIQPRAPAAPVREHVWSFAALRELREQLIDTLGKIRRGELTYADGPWCRWCPAAGVCPHLAAVARDSVATRLAAPELVAAGEFGAAQLDAALALAPALEHRIRAVHRLALEYLVAGGKLAGHKLVAKNAGGLTVAPRTDPRPEVSVSATLRAALRSAAARGYRTSETRIPPRGRDREQRREASQPFDGAPLIAP